MRAHEFIIENDFLLDNRRNAEFTAKDIQDVKDGYDANLTYAEIANIVQLPVVTVSNILTTHYPGRKKRNQQLEKALTDEDRVKILYTFADGGDVFNISKQMGISQSLTKKVLRTALGQEEFAREMAMRRLSTKRLPLNNKVTPEMIQFMRDEYVLGKGSEEIADMIGNISYSTVDMHMRRQPDWPELRAKWEERRKSVKHLDPATTKKIRSGEVGNQHQRGPNNRTAYRVDWGRGHR